ncbi:MAG: hypothetical protein R3F54_03715 [Alphaproteobacteria bacterium]
MTFKKFSPKPKVRDRPGDQRRYVVLDALQAMPVALHAKPRREVLFGEHHAADGYENETRIGENGQDAAVDERETAADHDQVADGERHLLV